MRPELLKKLAAALSREGKPRGDHMIEAYAMMAKVAESSGDEDQVALASVFDCASRSIAAETAMFDGLKAAVADILDAEVAASVPLSPDQRIERLEGVVHSLARWAWGQERANAALGARP
ncbi:hypothetical protein E4M02_02470 [Brevundimonas sp. S30B]|uniref:hypothetical protein n=1 Tax=unclassified Brevundimonas TaxID=2622653 RepID=UPI0010722244|nr:MULTISPECIES: hypothetical protein [unclassified Brevundimonas]QBX37245.1 hypothetical protein E4M01_05350 [Brevundimonas sp. MF30-B]TFW03962.1 hypothetical protein E4M02_02470 [Brevundimonas sp. S30B]